MQIISTFIVKNNRNDLWCFLFFRITWLTSSFSIFSNKMIMFFYFCVKYNTVFCADFYYNYDIYAPLFVFISLENSYLLLQFSHLCPSTIVFFFWKSFFPYITFSCFFKFYFFYFCKFAFICVLIIKFNFRSMCL
jgi:hypothetical protein